MEFTAGMIAAYLGGEVEGDADAVVSTFAKIEEGRPGALSFLANPKYEHYLYDTQSSVVIVDREFEARDTVRATLVRVTDAYASFAKLLELYAAHKPRKKGISDGRKSPATRRSAATATSVHSPSSRPVHASATTSASTRTSTSATG